METRGWRWRHGFARVMESNIESEKIQETLKERIDRRFMRFENKVLQEISSRISLSLLLQSLVSDDGRNIISMSTIPLMISSLLFWLCFRRTVRQDFISSQVSTSYSFRRQVVCAIFLSISSHMWFYNKLMKCVNWCHTVITSQEDKLRRKEVANNWCHVMI